MSNIHHIDSAPRDGTEVRVLAIGCWIKARYGDGVGWMSDDPLTYELRTGAQPVVHPEWWMS
jgi:hypothetical protein